MSKYIIGPLSPYTALQALPVEEYLAFGHSTRIHVQMLHSFVRFSQQALEITLVLTWRENRINMHNYKS